MRCYQSDVAKAYRILYVKLRNMPGKDKLDMQLSIGLLTVKKTLAINFTND